MYKNIYVQIELKVSTERILKEKGSLGSIKLSPIIYRWLFWSRLYLGQVQACSHQLIPRETGAA
jgi:hypothetical protein